MSTDSVAGSLPDVAIRNFAGEKDLLLEALQNIGVAGQFGTDHFQSDGATQFAVFGLVDRAHAAFSDGMQDLVASAQHYPRSQGWELPGGTGGFGWRRAVRPATVELGWIVRGRRPASWCQPLQNRRGVGWNRPWRGRLPFCVPRWG